MGGQLKIDWQQSSEELKHLYQKCIPSGAADCKPSGSYAEGNAPIGIGVVDLTGASYRSVQQWLRWYRQNGLSEVLRRMVGHHAKGKKPYLTQLQQRTLVAKVKHGQFRTVWEVIEWVRGRWGVSYAYKGMYTLMKGHGLGLKVLRPQSAKANAQQQATWKKGAY